MDFTYIFYSSCLERRNARVPDPSTKLTFNFVFVERFENILKEINVLKMINHLIIERERGGERDRKRESERERERGERQRMDDG